MERERERVRQRERERDRKREKERERERPGKGARRHGEKQASFLPAQASPKVELEVG